eukprot:TRINITY_DN7188_c0_g2_i1.p1 TRINITY_DN7188_c0_g2~~TRINITY_DN7188_c0_g2_i1.p1  ORF type:complete len:1183 (+),score=387.18 TRINITY_DN7188_c0_g2_i1:231-3551(+)
MAPPPNGWSGGFCETVERKLRGVRGAESEAAWWRNRAARMRGGGGGLSPALQHHRQRTQGSDEAPDSEQVAQADRKTHRRAAPAAAGPAPASSVAAAADYDSDGDTGASGEAGECWNWRQLRRSVAAVVTRNQHLLQPAPPRQQTLLSPRSHGGCDADTEAEAHGRERQRGERPRQRPSGPGADGEAERGQDEVRPRVADPANIRLLEQFGDLRSAGPRHGRQTVTSQTAATKELRNSYGATNKDVLALLEFKEEAEMREEAQAKQQQMRLRLQHMEERRRDQWQDKLSLPAWKIRVAGSPSTASPAMSAAARPHPPGVLPDREGNLSATMCSPGMQPRQPTASPGLAPRQPTAASPGIAPRQPTASPRHASICSPGMTPGMSAGSPRHASIVERFSEAPVATRTTPPPPDGEDAVVEDAPLGAPRIRKLVSAFDPAAVEKYDGMLRLALQAETALRREALMHHADAEHQRRTNRSAEREAKRAASAAASHKERKALIEERAQLREQRRQRRDAKREARREKEVQQFREAEQRVAGHAPRVERFLSQRQTLAQPSDDCHLQPPVFRWQLRKGWNERRHGFVDSARGAAEDAELSEGDAKRHALTARLSHAADKRGSELQRLRESAERLSQRQVVPSPPAPRSTRRHHGGVPEVDEELRAKRKERLRDRENRIARHLEQMEERAQERLKRAEMVRAAVSAAAERRAEKVGKVQVRARESNLAKLEHHPGLRSADPQPDSPHYCAPTKALRARCAHAAPEAEMAEWVAEADDAIRGHLERFEQRRAEVRQGSAPAGGGARQSLEAAARRAERAECALQRAEEGSDEELRRLQAREDTLPKRLADAKKRQQELREDLRQEKLARGPHTAADAVAGQGKPPQVPPLQLREERREAAARRRAELDEGKISARAERLQRREERAAERIREDELQREHRDEQLKQKWEEDAARVAATRVVGATQPEPAPPSPPPPPPPEPWDEEAFLRRRQQHRVRLRQDWAEVLERRQLAKQRLETRVEERYERAAYARSTKAEKLQGRRGEASERRSARLREIQEARRAGALGKLAKLQEKKEADELELERREASIAARAYVLSQRIVRVSGGETDWDSGD